MRNISSNIQQVLDANYGETKDLVVITIPEQVEPPYPETVLRFVNGSGIVIDSELYSNKLRSLGNLRFSLGHNADNASFTLENVTKELGLTLNDTKRFIDGSKVEILKAFKVHNGEWETVTLFVGNVKDVKVDQESVNITATSDMSKRGTSVAGRTLTQRCIFVFNKNGSGIGPECGWKTTQPGDPEFCDHDLSTTSGCKAHGNQHRFGGVPAFTALSNGNGYDPNNGGSWGTGTGGGWCVHPNSWILCVNTQGLRYWLRAFQVKANVDIVVSMDKFGRLKRSEVKMVTKGDTTHLYTIMTEGGYGIQCSPSHPIITHFNDDKGTPASKLYIGDTVLVAELGSSKPRKDKIKSIEIAEYSCNVIIFGLEEPYHIYVAGMEKDGGILSHNAKPVLDARMQPL